MPAIPRPLLPPGPHLVVGLARSGVAAALALRARGDEVRGADSGRVPEAEARRLEAAGVTFAARAAGLDMLPGVATVVKSPGVPGSAPVIRAAREAGIPVFGELEIAWRLLPQQFLAVTGSNGKTTSVELLGAMHRAAGREVVVAGNVGTALSSLVGQLPPEATVVCEASSFQLEDALAFAPEIGVLLNITSDHLDRHGTLAAYRAAKLRLFAAQPESGVAVVPDDLPDRLDGAARRVFFGAGPRADLRERDGRLWWHGDELMPVDEIGLPGRHNVENAMACAAAGLSAGLPAEAVVAALRDFAGVEHRLETVAVIDDVTYVNDSKATNVASAAVGISSYPQGVHVILGGRGKGEDYAPLLEPVRRSCRAVYLIGETAPALSAALTGTRIELRDCGDLEHAVAAARAGARPGDVVLLSPACASFDQYASFEERGEHFRELVGAIS